MYEKDGGLRTERGHSSVMFVRPHKYESIAPYSEAFGGVNYGRVLHATRTNDNLTLTSNTLSDNQLANYTISGIMTNNKGTTTYTDGSIQSIVRQDWNPALFFTDEANLWAYGDGGFGLKLACGYDGFMGSDYSRVGNSLVEDNRWATKTQFKGDMTNFIYSMWGTDVTGDTNVAPPPVVGDFNYIDLSNSPNSVTVPYKVKNIGFSAQNSWINNSVFRYGNFQTHTTTDEGKGDLSLTFPLFYRVRWADMLSGEFKYNGNSLCKSYV